MNKREIEIANRYLIEEEIAKDEEIDDDDDETGETDKETETDTETDKETETETEPEEVEEKEDKPVRQVRIENRYSENEQNNAKHYQSPIFEYMHENGMVKSLKELASFCKTEAMTLQKMTEDAEPDKKKSFKKDMKSLEDSANIIGEAARSVSKTGLF
jgi:hypothetical protein